MDKIVLSDAFARPDELWRPKVVAEVNTHGQQVVKIAADCRQREAR